MILLQHPTISVYLTWWIHQEYRAILLRELQQVWIFTKVPNQEFCLKSISRCPSATHAVLRNLIPLRIPKEPPEEFVVSSFSPFEIMEKHKTIFAGMIWMRNKKNFSHICNKSQIKFYFTEIWIGLRLQIDYW